MKIKEIRDFSVDELEQKERGLIEELFKLRLRHATAQLDSPFVMRNIRKDVARIKTVLREREAGR
ncbi:MAG: 50S ribosomal protein L29 [Proteobacteria bacterium]|nr:50S ribosomal protein L29 [Pseudomonadota bacterium]